MVRRSIGAVAVLLSVACGVSETNVAGSEETQATAASNLSYTLPDTQFAGGFTPRNAPFGGFGGGTCVATHTPVVFIPGNGDDARNYDFPSSTGVPSSYDTLRAAGYNDCEIFGINWLSTADRQQPLYNYHTAAKAKIVADFITDVLAFTGKTQVDVIGHSMGVTVGLHAIERYALQSKLRRFIGISGGMRGLSVCPSVGYANPLYPVCGSQNIFDSDTFGYYPTLNTRMQNGGFRDVPSRLTAARFYSIGADINDGFLCPTNAFTSSCGASARVDARSNVLSQLDVGSGSTSLQLDYNLSDYSVFVAGAGDVDGVGHFRAKNNTGQIQLNMLTTSCTGTACCAGYSPTCG